MRRWLLVALIVLALVAGSVVYLVTRDRGEDPRAEPPLEPTVWERITASIGPDGRWGKQEALQAFMFSFGPIPDVTLPRGRKDPSDLAISGSSAIHATFAHWPELSDAQRRAVIDALRQPEEPPRLRQTVTQKDRARQVLTAAVTELVTAISARLKKTIPAPKLHLAEKENSRDKATKAWTWLLGDRDQVLDDENVLTFPEVRAHSCHVFIPPSTWREAATKLTSDHKSRVAHELMHCFQGHTYPTIGAFNRAPLWIKDGGAEFGAYVVSDRSQDAGSWQGYLTKLKPLFDRQYDAIGFWFHLESQLYDPWQTMPVIWAGAQENMPAYRTAGGDADNVYSSWAASLIRQPDFSARWETQGVGVPPAKPPRKNLHQGDGTLSAPPFDPRIGVINATSSAPIVRIRAWRPVQVHDQRRFEDLAVTNAEYCAHGSCVCPDGSRPVKQKVTAPLYLAVPGSEFTNAAVVDFISLKEYCKKKPDPKPTPGPGPSPPVSKPKASSNGDPHLISFDGNAFDFQAGGEFTLARSDSGDVEIQARQEPYRPKGEPEDLSISVNTAVAATVAGDRIMFRTGKSRPELTIGGVVVAPSGEHRLPHGGVITPQRRGYTVTWPDKSTLDVLSIGDDYGLNVVIDPAEARKNTLHGLLGPFTGTESTAMEDRAGKKYDWVPWNQLYDVIGESWRVDRAGSLFDYRPGESVDTFTRRDMPQYPSIILTGEQSRAGDAACDGIADPLMRHLCVFDVGRTGKIEFAEGYEAVEELSREDVQVGPDKVDHGEGPLPLRPGDKRTFTFPGTPETDLYLRLDSGDGESGDITVAWSLTGPDNQSTSQFAPGGVSYHRLHTTTAGEWTLDLEVPADSAQPGPMSWRVVTAGPVRNSSVTLPAELDGDLTGPGAKDRIRFTARKDQLVTLTADKPCPFGELVELRVLGPGNEDRWIQHACDGPLEYYPPEDGEYTITMTHQTADSVTTPYRLRVTG